MGLRGGRAAAIAVVLTAGALPSDALGQRLPGIDCNLFGPGQPCPPYLLYPPGQDLRVTVPTPMQAGQALDLPAVNAGLNTLSELFAQLRSCWRPPDAAQATSGMEITVRVSFNRNGYIIGAPRLTYVQKDAPEYVRDIYRRAVTQSLQRCEPLPLTKALGGAIAGRPFSIRYIDDRNIPKTGA